MRTIDEERISIDHQTSHAYSNEACSFIYQLPDILLQRNRGRKMPYAETFRGIVLFADISGFTEMCEKYSNDVRRGVNQLANGLNEYMAPIVEAILREKGDVYKFAGDAVLGTELNGQEKFRKECDFYLNQVCGLLRMISASISMNKQSVSFLVLCT